MNKQIWSSIHCPRCGCVLDKEAGECEHCHAKFEWVTVSVPIYKDGSETNLRGSIVTPTDWGKKK